VEEDKGSSLSSVFVSDEDKSFVTLTAGVNIIKN
jgi:hypothetical protein